MTALSATAPPCFALLDDAGHSVAHARFLHGLSAHLVCDDVEQLPHLLHQMEQHLQAGQHAVLLLSYELGAAMHAVAAWPETAQLPFAQALIFSTCEHFNAAATEQWLTQAADELSGIADLHANLEQSEFAAALAQIRAYIEAGDTYQVNFTYRLRFQVYGSALALYRRLRLRQPVPYGALIQLPNGQSIVSLSPELFVRHQRGQLFAQPMKGTAPASADPAENAARAQALAQDEKNRAENLMIVDLLRNDLGRIAEPGSVQVPNLFEVRQFSSVLQMTSSIQAQLRSELGLADIVQALYPCGSITGAPKRRTMEIIRELETAPRGIYTGAIGWFAPPAELQPLGDFCLSVPIRTMLLQAAQENGLCAAEMGVGAGIVYDSQSAEEFQECQLKASFLSQLSAPLELFETIYATQEDGCRQLEAHLQRLSQSCTWFGIAFDCQSVRQELVEVCSNFAHHTPHRIKLSITGAGQYRIEHAPLAELSTPVKLIVSQQVNQLPRFLLAHKSNQRSEYDAAWRAAEAHAAFDQLFCNAQGNITEGGRSNIFVKLAGRWYTPPVADGVLPGIMRAQLLADAAWQAEERSISLAQLHAAEEVVVCNALRGVLKAQLAWLT